MKFITITQEAETWERLAGLLGEITHGTKKDEEAIEQFRTKIKQSDDEYVLCSNDFFHFAKYLRAVHPTRGYIPLDCYPYHHRLISHYESHRFSLVKKFRQGAFSTYTVAYMLWRAMFKPDQAINIICKTDREAIDMGEIAQRMIAMLPQWLTPRLAKCNDRIKQFKDTDSCMFFATLEAMCGRAITWLIMDEVAFFPNAEPHWKAMYPTLSTGGSCILISTPYRKWEDKKKQTKTWFYKMYSDAIDKKNNFAVFDVSYKEHPDYNNVEWVKNTILQLGSRGWQQEVEAEFLD